MEGELNGTGLDALRETASIAAGNAVTSLAELLGIRVDISVPVISMEALQKTPDLFGGYEKAAAVVYFRMEGEVDGYMLLVLPEDTSIRISNILTNRNAGNLSEIDDFGVSALKELGNIVVGAYIRVLADDLKLKLIYSVPGFADDMIGAILNDVLARMATTTDYAVVIESDFSIRGEGYGSILLLLSFPAVERVLTARRIEA